MRWLVALCALLSASWPVAGSLLEDSTDEAVAYQFDAGTFHDAPDACGLATPFWQVQVGNETNGMLLPPDDEADFITFDVTPDLVGGRISVSLGASEVPMELSLDVLLPECDGSVLDAENQPVPEPQVPQPGPGQSQYTVHNLDGGTCSDRWFFVLNQVKTITPPDSIFVTWTNGESQAVPIGKQTRATTVHYETAENLGYTLRSITVNIDSAWTGEFNIGERPCGAVDGQAVFGEPAVRQGDSITFTPIVAGLHVVGVVLEDPEAPAPAVGPAPMTCHFCLEQGDDASEPLQYPLKVEPVNF